MISENENRGRVTVYGSDMRKPPLVDSSEPELILIRDGFGEPLTLLVRILSEDTWGLVTRGDPDFADMLVRSGLARLRGGVSAQQLIREGVGACADLPVPEERQLNEQPYE